MLGCKSNSQPDAEAAWSPLGAPPHELQLDFCLPTGQSFRWRQTGIGEYTGVIGSRLVCLRQLKDDVVYRVLARGGQHTAPEGDAAALRDYFNLDTSLSDLAAGWAASCDRFKAVSPHFPGARMLRQDPLECLFQFICSSNNHISRIHGMVERLCSAYGTPLEPTPSAVREGWLGGHAASQSAPQASKAGASGLAAQRPGGEPARAKAGSVGTSAAASTSSQLCYYAFPSLEQLSTATEAELRAAGFGYRARFIVGTTQALLAKPGGGREWLLSLRQVGLEEAVAALTELPGIGPKVAACISLFSLDKHSAIPVDTHVWQIAVRHYCPQLRGKSLTKKVHAEVQQVFVGRFGSYAGWAHNTLFISELASQQHRLPEELRQVKKGASPGKAKRQARGHKTSEGTDSAESEEGGVYGSASSPSASEDGSGDDDESGGHAGGRPARRLQRTGPAATRATRLQGRRRPKRLVSTANEETGEANGGVGSGLLAAVPDGQADLASPAKEASGKVAQRRQLPAAAPEKQPSRGGRKRGVSAPTPPKASQLQYDVEAFDDLAT